MISYEKVRQSLKTVTTVLAILNVLGAILQVLGIVGLVWGYQSLNNPESVKLLAEQGIDPEMLKAELLSPFIIFNFVLFLSLNMAVAILSFLNNGKIDRQQDLELSYLPYLLAAITTVLSIGSTLLNGVFEPMILVGLGLNVLLLLLPFFGYKHTKTLKEKTEN